MPRKAKLLSALEVGRLKAAGHHAVGGVDGLYFYVTDTGGRSWVLRTMVGTKRRHMGLGGYPETSLAQAREFARTAKEEVRNGVDPIAKRASRSSAIRLQQAQQITFSQAAESYVQAHGQSWKNAKHRAQWLSTLQTYAYPVMGSLLVRDIHQEHVLQVLEAIWSQKTETATRLRGRIESVLDWATVRKLREGENPARWKGRLDKLLPAPSKVQKVEHHRALPIEEMPDFMARLRCRSGVAARALEFLILCAARSGEVRGATWDEIDLELKVWAVPATRMKSGREHRVPLVDAAVELLRGVPRVEESPYLFPSVKGKVLSDMTLTAVMRRIEVDAVPHGFRSTFRDWVGECTEHPSEVAEQALAHTLPNKVEAAYRRGDALQKRRKLMADWADFCGVLPRR